MAERVAWFLDMAYAPAVWVLAAWCAVLGVAGVLVPSTFKRWMGLFQRQGPARISGLIMMLLGTLMFVRADLTAVPTLVKITGVVVFMFGGVHFVIPTVVVIIAEWWSERSNMWYRGLGLVHLGVAYLLYVESKLAEVVEDVIDKATSS